MSLQSSGADQITGRAFVRSVLEMVSAPSSVPSAILRGMFGFALTKMSAASALLSAAYCQPRCVAQHLLPVVGGDERGDLRRSRRQRARLVEAHRANASQLLQRLAAAEQHLRLRRPRRTKVQFRQPHGFRSNRSWA